MGKIGPFVGLDYEIGQFVGISPVVGIGLLGGTGLVVSLTYILAYNIKASGRVFSKFSIFVIV